MTFIDILLCIYMVIIIGVLFLQIYGLGKINGKFDGWLDGCDQSKESGKEIMLNKFIYEFNHAWLEMSDNSQIKTHDLINTIGTFIRDCQKELYGDTELARIPAKELADMWNEFDEEEDLK